MAENLKTVPPEATEPQEETTEKTTIRQKIRSYRNNHPRIARVVGYTAAAAAVVGAVVVGKNLMKDEVHGELLQLDATQDPSYLGPETTTVTEA